MKLPMSVAGATLLSIGSSAPELLTSLSDVFFTKNNVGFGSIIGSAMFNNMVIIGISLIYVDEKICLNIKTFTRDIVAFIISVITSGSMVFISDSITSLNGFILIILYGVYIFVMFYFDLDNKTFHCEEEITSSKQLFVKLIGIIMNMIVLSCISVSVVFMTSQVGCTWGIDPMVMGIIFIAIGTSMPDIFVSISQVKNGNLDTAISNAIGANIFDFFIGLGLPWYLSNTILEKPIVVDEKSVFDQIVWAVCTSVIMLVLLSFSNNPMYYNLVGYFLISMYLCYLLFVMT
jgi:cation:H+ antiporter